MDNKMKETVCPWTCMQPHRRQYCYRYFSNVNKATTFATEQSNPICGQIQCDQDSHLPGGQGLSQEQRGNTPSKSNTKKTLKTTALYHELTPLLWPIGVHSVFKTVIAQVQGAVSPQQHS